MMDLIYGFMNLQYMRYNALHHLSVGDKLIFEFMFDGSFSSKIYDGIFIKQNSNLCYILSDKYYCVHISQIKLL